MSHTSNGIINAPIDVIGDVAVMFGLSNGDVAYLCSNDYGRINKWSRYKPVRHTKVVELEDSDFQSVNYGLDVGNADRRTYDPLDETWRSTLANYLPPIPGTNYSRLTDFNGYSHNAQPPISPPGDISLSVLAPSVDIYFANNGIAQTTDLTLNDFLFLHDYYPCLVISYTYEGSGSYMYVTTSSPFGASSDNGYITIRKSDINSSWKNVKYYMCGYSTQQTSLSDPNGLVSDVVVESSTPDTVLDGVFISLPSAVKLEGNITIEPAINLLELVAYGVISGTVSSTTKFLDISQYMYISTSDDNLKLSVGRLGTLSMSFTLTNKTSSEITVKQDSLYFRPVSNLAGSTSAHILDHPSAMYTVDGDTCTSVTRVTVPANGSVSIALTFDGAGVTSDEGLVVLVSSDTSSYMQINLYYSDTTAELIGSASLNIKY